MMICDCGSVIVCAAGFETAEEARAAVPAVLERAERERWQQGLLTFDEPEPAALPEPEPEVIDAEVVETPPARKKVTVPRDADVCRAMAALMLSLFFPGDERSVENTVHRFSLRGKGKVERAVKFLVDAGLIETYQQRKRTYFAAAPAVCAGLIGEGVA